VDSLFQQRYTADDLAGQTISFSQILPCNYISVELQFNPGYLPEYLANIKRKRITYSGRDSESRIR